MQSHIYNHIRNCTDNVRMYSTDYGISETHQVDKFGKQSKQGSKLISETNAEVLIQNLNQVGLIRRRAIADMSTGNHNNVCSYVHIKLKIT